MKEPTRSQLSTAEAPRLELRLLYPPDVTDLDMVLLLRTLRAAPLGQGLFYGLQGLFAAGDGMILEVTASTSLLQFWALCSQMVIVNGSRALIYSDATAEHWTRTMDAVVRNNEPECAPKLRWRGSMHGGRAIATPTATTATLSAARRIGRRPATAHDNTAVISVRGETGLEDAAMLQHIMAHITEKLRIATTPAVNVEAPRPGEFAPFIRPDGSAEPGKTRMICRTVEEVTQLYAALNGQHVSIGTDLLGVHVQNDAIAAGPLTGGRKGARR